MKLQILYGSGPRLARHDERVRKSSRKFPQTTCAYRANREGSGSSSAAWRPALGERGAQIKSLRELSTMGDTEARWLDAAEAIAFGLVIAIVVWSVVVLLQTVRG